MHSGVTLAEAVGETVADKDGADDADDVGELVKVAVEELLDVGD